MEKSERWGTTQKLSISRSGNVSGSKGPSWVSAIIEREVTAEEEVEVWKLGDKLGERKSSLGHVFLKK